MFYRIKPAVPRAVQIALRRRLARRQARRDFPAWPVETALLRRRAEALSEELRAQGTDRLRILSPWPDGHEFAVILTHDVEGPLGLERMSAVLELERRYGFRSAWNFVAEWYPVTEAHRQLVRDAGGEVGLHGITHDGALFLDRQSFEASLPKIRAYLDAWGAVGFRSPSTLRNPEWMEELPVGYDGSFTDTDPFGPQPGGCCWIFPFFLGEVVELPMTLDQDHTLFVLLRESSAARWQRKAQWLIANRGLISVNVHPDYMDASALGYYEEFLRFLAEQDAGWRALPHEVADWWRHRAATIYGAASDGGGVTEVWARPQDGRIAYEP
jgi:peptidoglycan/xylan/chitin deacetylase (PgdA/CDA1 family)